MDTQILLNELRAAQQHHGDRSHLVTRHQARQRLLHLAKERHGEATFKLGNHYLASNNIRKAMWWYQRSAESGHRGAQYNLGLLYLKGEDIPRDALKGLEWITRAANTGDQQAQALLRRIDRALVVQ